MLCVQTLSCFRTAMASRQREYQGGEFAEGQGAKKRQPAEPRPATNLVVCRVRKLASDPKIRVQKIPSEAGDEMVVVGTTLAEDALERPHSELQEVICLGLFPLGQVGAVLVQAPAHSASRNVGQVEQGVEARDRKPLKLHILGSVWSVLAASTVRPAETDVAEQRPVEAKVGEYQRLRGVLNLAG